MTSTSPIELDPAPRSLDVLTDPAWLSAALDDIGPVDRIVDVEQVDRSATVASKVRIRVVTEGPGGGQTTHAYCIKAHLDNDVESLGSETNFYRNLAPVVGVRTPHAYYTGIDSSGRSLIVMDDVYAIGGTFQSAESPYTLDTIRGTLGQLATVHAATWGDEQLLANDWLRPRLQSMAANYPAERLDEMMNDGRGPDLPDWLRSGDILKRAVTVTGEVPSTCVIHGDAHSGNTYLDRDGRACWLDWQCTQGGHWATDVSYHMGTALSIGDRRAHERELLEHYLGELAAHGVDPPPWDEAWERYTLHFSYGYLLWAITMISSRAVVLIHIPRLGTAIEDHDTFRRLGVL